MEQHPQASRLAEIVTNIRGAAEMVAALATPWRRPSRTSWGATPAEAHEQLPGDELVSDPLWQYTHAITIDAPPHAVWPWLAQLGQGRGGLYSFEHLENLVGCHIHNTDRILADHQAIAVGDPIALHPKSPPLVVAIVEPDHHLVFASGLQDANSTWSFHLLDGLDGTTRLIERGAYRPGPSRAERLALGPAILEPVSFVMSREMLRTIRIRAEEAAARASARVTT